MNHIEETKSLTDLLQRYRDYLPMCPINKLNKLALEICSVNNRIAHLENLTLGNAIQQGVSEFFGELESSLNF